MTDLSAILYWYTGKAKAAIRDFALPTLAAAEEAGFWPPKVSRRVRALLNKQSVAAKFARSQERDNHRDGDAGRLEDVCDVRGARYYESKSGIRGWHALHAMEFGYVLSAPAILKLTEQLAPHCICDAERDALAVARRWATDFTPVAELVARLDATRPKPTFVFQEISKTVYANVCQVMRLAFESVRVPEMRWHRQEHTDDDGKLRISFWCEIVWPEGTRHDTSKFSEPHQCQACGHAIRRSDNWVPLVVDSARGDRPASLWVGRDCARHLFGCVVTGEGTELRRGAPTPPGGEESAP